MRKIYKMLILLFIIIVLASTIGIAAKPIPTPNPGRFHIGGNVDYPETNLWRMSSSITPSALSGTLYMTDSFPTTNGWYGSVFNTDTYQASFNMRVICANVQ